MQIHWRDPNHVSVERQLQVEAEIEELRGGRNDLIDVWIDVDKDPHHRSGRDRVKIRCEAREVELVAEGQGADVDEALREALAELERQVRRRRERRSGRAQAQAQARAGAARRGGPGEEPGPEPTPAETEPGAEPETPAT